MNPKYTGTIMTEDGPVSVGYTENEQLLVKYISEMNDDIKRMNALLDQADAILRRNNERVTKIRSEFNLIMLACFTAGFGMGVSIVRIVDGW